MDKIQAQKDEFDAIAKLVEQYHRITLTPIVDGDYPEFWLGYRCAIRDLIGVVKVNGRLA